MQFQWLAVYGENDVLAQYPKEGVENKYGDIDRERLVQFVVITREPNPKTMLVVHIPKGGRLIYRQRVEMRTGDGQIRVWIVGTQTNIGGKNSQYVCALFEDGHIEIVDRWIENSRWFHSPTFHPNEGEVWDN